MTRRRRPTPRAICLALAHEAAVERGEQYGAPAEFFARVAERWSLTLGITIAPRQVLLCMIDVKQARAIAGRKGDTAVDIAGYAACLFEIDQA